MSGGWSVTIEGRPAKPVDPEALFEQLAKHHPAVAGGRERLSVTVTIDAAAPDRAIARALTIVAGVVPGMAVELVEAMTEARQDEELERSNLPDLVGIAEMAEMAGTSRQRAFQMTANRGFPVALLELASGRLWSRAAVQGYLDAREASRAPRAKVAMSAAARR